MTWINILCDVNTRYVNVRVKESEKMSEIRV